jgi:hypothetical protein
MKLGRTYRTVRHLTASQWAYRFLCRGKFAAMECLPHAALSLFSGVAVPLPDPASPLLAAAAAHVIALQRAVHGPFAGTVPRGCFILLNREVDFGVLDRVEWRRDLGEKNNRLWRMNLAYMGYLVPLFEADAQAAIPLARTLLAGMRAQNDWSMPGIFRDVWHPYSVSHRVINLLTCLHLAHKAGVPVPPEALDDFVSEIRLGAAFVRYNLEQDLQFNHLLKNYVSLALVAAAGKTQYAARTLRKVRACVAQQFLPDGGQAERAPMYHLLSLLDLRMLRDSGVLASGDTSFIAETAAKAEAAARAMVHPDGDVAMFNDSWIGEAPPATALAAGLNLSPIEPLAAELPDTGYVRLAQGGDSVVMDFGACGPDNAPGHAHADFLSLELSVGGKRAIVDSGVPTYSEGALRDFCRSAGAHNGPAFEGVEPLEFWSSFRVGRRGSAHKLALPQRRGTRLAFAAWQDGYGYIGGTVARAIRLIPGKGLLIADIWAGLDKHAAASQFLIGGSWTQLEGTCFAGSGAAEGMPLHLVALEGEIRDVRPAAYWERFGVERNGTQATLSAAQAGAFRIACLLVKWRSKTGDFAEPWTELRKDLIVAFGNLPTVKPQLGGTAELVLPLPASSEMRLIPVLKNEEFYSIQTNNSAA